MRRYAVAREDGSTVIAVGGRPGVPFMESAWEYSFAARPYVDAGDYERAIELASEGLERHADDAGLLYNIGCWEALAGRRADALAHVRRAYELAPEKVREWAKDDPDLDSIRVLPRGGRRCARVGECDVSLSLASQTPATQERCDLSSRCRHT